MYPKKEFQCDGCHATFCWYKNFVVHKEMYCRGRTKVLPCQSTQDEPTTETTNMPRNANLEQKAYMEGFPENLNSTSDQFKPEANSLIANHPDEQHTNDVPATERTQNCDVATSSEISKKSETCETIKPIYEDISLTCYRCSKKFIWYNALRTHELLGCKGESIPQPSEDTQSYPRTESHNSITISKGENLSGQTSPTVLNRNFTTIASTPEEYPSIANHLDQQHRNHAAVPDKPLTQSNSCVRETRRSESTTQFQSEIANLTQQPCLKYTTTEYTTTVVDKNLTMPSSSESETDRTTPDCKTAKESTISTANCGIASPGNYKNAVPYDEELPAKLFSDETYPAQDEKALATQKIFSPAKENTESGTIELLSNSITMFNPSPPETHR